MYVYERIPTISGKIADGVLLATTIATRGLAPFSAGDSSQSWRVHRKWMEMMEMMDGPSENNPRCTNVAKCYQ